MDHPRLCGEKFFTPYTPHAVRGSPPPMRGKVQKKICKNRIDRITPAYAGKSITMVMLVTSGKDHPRLCGEKQCTRFAFAVIIGSPPPMRGKDGARRGALMTFRITPAYAGKSGGNDRTYTAEKDHPRLCGEKFSVHYLTTSRSRITPAYAGKRSAIS